MVTSSVSPQLQFANILTEWKVTLQREGGTKTSVTIPFTVSNAQLTVNHLLPATRYTVWVSVKAGSAEGPLSNGLQVTTQEGGEIGQVLGVRVTIGHISGPLPATIVDRGQDYVTIDFV